MSSAVSSPVVQYHDYVAGWLDTSIHDFLAHPGSQPARAAYALITCLDSGRDPAVVFKQSAPLQALLSGAQSLGNGLLIPSRLLTEPQVRDMLFFGFDEVWFFPSDTVRALPRDASIVGPYRIDQSSLDLIGPWMSENECSLGLGDGAGLNLVVKAHGLAKQVVANSLYQRELAAKLQPQWVEDEEKKTATPPTL